MASTRKATIVGVFEDRARADQAIRDLRAAGFRDDQIGVASGRGETDTWAETKESGETHADTGALTGALTGAGLGALAGLGILAGIIPVVGPAIVGGTLGVILTNAAAGAGLAGLAGALIGAGVPEEEATYYEGELKSGRTIVTVHANGRAAEARSILTRHGAYDMSSRGAAATASSAACATAAGSSRVADKGEKIQVREEELHAHTRPVEAGEVRVRKDVVTEHKTIEVPVEHEEVVIERRPASGKAVSGEIRPGEEIRIPVKEEQVVVEKQAVVKEEVSVGKRTVKDTERVSGEVRKEQVRIEREGDVDVCSTDRDESKRPRRS
jgi:uncharacterized protein (TIGR02271 family)